MLKVIEIMLQMANMYYIFRVILVQILFLNVINAEFKVDRNVTKYDPIQTSERLKRAPTFHRSIPPSVLTATIIDEDEEIHLRWERVDRYLFNENLPVYTARMNSWGATHKKSNVMKGIGKTIIYHDVAQKSAIIYFEEQNAIFGTVGQSYEIRMLRLHELSRPLIVGEGIVHRQPAYGIHGSTKLNPSEIPPYPELSEKGKLNFGEASSSNSEIREDSIAERFYIETLLFVTYDIFGFVHDAVEDNMINYIVISYLSHINAVDMIFAMLPTNQFEIYINLAGIIIEEEDGVFSEILQYPPLRHDNRQELYNDDSLFELFAHYPAHFDFPFAKDSFDLMLISTGRELHYNDGVYAGWNSLTKDIFLERQSGNPYIPSIMIRSTDMYSQYPLVAHLIADFLGLENTNPCDFTPGTDAEIQCYSIMQRLDYYCSQCITWNSDSISQLATFFRKDPNRCFYLNKPRSLYPAGTPVISVSPCRQCTCFGFHSYGRESRNECPFYIPPEDCGEPLLCKRQHGGGNQRLEKSILPFDGTPCGKNKVCWNEACISMSGATSQSRV